MQCSYCDGSGGVCEYCRKSMNLCACESPRLSPCVMCDGNGEDGLDDGDFEEEDREDYELWSCLFPGKCCMPGEHMRSECHTAEMAEEYSRYMESQSQPVVTLRADVPFEEWSPEQQEAFTAMVKGALSYLNSKVNRHD